MGILNRLKSEAALTVREMDRSLSSWDEIFNRRPNYAREKIITEQVLKIVKEHSRLMDKVENLPSYDLTKPLRDEIIEDMQSQESRLQNTIRILERRNDKNNTISSSNSSKSMGEERTENNKEDSSH
jgi:hypothetical protein